MSAGRALYHRRLCSAAFWGLGALACAPPAAAPRAPEPSPPTTAPGELGRGARDVEAQGQGLELRLPDAAGWRRDPREAQSWVAAHAATRSRLIVRAWSSDTRARPAECERELRRFRPDLPRLRPEEQLEARPLRVAGGHAALLVTGVTASTAAALDGHALLFAADGRHCFGLIYSTSADGDAAPRVLAERLATMTRIAFERVRRLEIEQRVQVPRH